ncbi:uncharacterized protein LOC106075073 isoform X3 [Biomphalaria glabrata]|uniref:Uncharacterized protein LOC106075073 isoform X3 n=1 Tax=Biomphalaria glabrata TaxID=6526 RepID=A0A9W2ZJU4_BIOGL|nr:uncharacterized protein LOC106075073 isoform X3 [Biomphalaria glabrata]
MLFFVFLSFIPVSLSTLNERNWIWNSSTETWLDFHVKYCGRFCTGNTLNGKNYCNNPPCFPCDCDSNCFIYDTCCPLFVNNSYIEPPLNEIQQLSSPDIFQCQTLPYIQKKDKYYIISNCDPKFSLQNKNVLDQSSRNISDLCRNPNTRTLDDMTPYSDIYYGVVFANKFCAMCNGYEIEDNTNHKNINSSVKIASAWSVNVYCEHYQVLYHFTSEYEFLLSAANMSKCTINSLPPLTNLKPKSCGSEVDTFSDDTCGDFDLKATHLCHSLNRRYLKAGAKANIFCHLCSNSSMTNRSCVAPTRNPMPIRFSDGMSVNVNEPPYSLLLSFQKLPGKGSIEEMNCNVHKKWQDLKGECHAASCTAGKIATEDGKCKTAISGIRGLAYHLALTLMYENDVEMTQSEMTDLFIAIKRKLVSKFSRSQLFANVTIATIANGSKLLHLYRIVGDILADDEKSRDEFETEIVQMVTLSWVLPLAHMNMSNITLKPLILGAEYHTVEFINLSMPSNLTTNQYQKKIIHSGGGKRNLPKCCKFIDLTYTLLCPYVAVNISSVKVNMLDIHLSFNYDGRVIEVVGGPNISVVNGELHICLETFKTLIKTNPVQSPADIALYYFQIVCILFSVVCLVMSLVTYFLFSSLRTLPGLNNMCLCLSMLCAQVSLLLTVEFGVKGQLPPKLCMFHAIFLHFSWLASFAWMSGCCIHMFLAFTSYTSPRNVVNSDIRRHIRFFIYGFGVPLLIVAANLGINAGLTKGQSIGYDDTICFLDTRMSALTIILTLLVPLCAMVFSNGVLFTLTLREMLHIAKIRKAATGMERQGVMTYVKLSTLTGVFCIVAAVAVWLENLILQFLTCPLMALQGVFLFFSFIFNKRVGKLYCDMLGLHRLGITLTTQSSSSQSASVKRTKHKKRIQYSQSTSSTNM